MSCLREVQTISKSLDILPMPSLTRLTTGGVLNPLKNTTNTSHNELLHQDPLQPPLEPRPRSLGLIPAHAGENLPLSWEPPMLVGSSPLTRGKHVECEQIPRLQGLIPAHAGKTSCARGRGPFARAHPHSCGENPRLQACRALALGSSPLTRGKHGDGLLVDFQHGIIPAHAGKTRRQGR